MNPAMVLSRACGVVLGAIYGALVAACVPVTLFDWAAGQFMGGIVGTLALVALAAAPVLALFGAAIGARAGWVAAAPRTSLLDISQDGPIPASKPNVQRNEPSPPLFFAVVSGTAAFAICDWGIREALPPILPDVERFFGIAPGAPPLPDHAWLELTLLMLAGSVAVGRLAYYRSKRRLLRAEAATVANLAQGPPTP